MTSTIAEEVMVNVLQKGGMIGSAELITCKNGPTADRFQAMFLRCAMAESEQNRGLGAKPPEISFRAAPFRSLENALKDSKIIPTYIYT